MPGLLLTTVSRHAWSHEHRLSPVAMPNTQPQGGVHALRMRKAWTPPWGWVFGIATGLSLCSWLQAWRLTVVNSKPGMAIHPEKLLALNVAYWFVPALLMPAVVWGARRFPFDNGRKVRAVLAHTVGALLFSFTCFIGMV